jgi:hypothetical protein
VQIPQQSTGHPPKLTSPFIANTADRRDATTQIRIVLIISFLDGEYEYVATVRDKFQVGHDYKE